MTSRLTKRAVGQILIAVQDKLAQLIADYLPSEDPALVKEALDQTDVKNVVQRHIKDENIGLVNPKKGRVFRTQLSIIGDKGMERAGKESPNAQEQAQYQGA